MRGLQNAGLWGRMCLLCGSIQDNAMVTDLRQGPGDGGTYNLVDKEVLEVIDNVSHNGVSKLCLSGNQQVLGAENWLVPFVDVV